MRILVTGGAGFIGSHIADALIAGGHQVSVVDNLATGRRENLNPKASFYHKDIRDRGISEVFEKERPEVVCHQAAQVSVRHSVADPCSDAEINVVGSINIAEQCRAFGVRKLVFASSGGAIYGEQEVYPAPETHPRRPVSPYGAAKLSFEQYLGYYREVFGLQYAALRYSNVYGPRQDPHGEAGVVAIFTSLMLKGQAPTINGDGGQTRDYVYVGDVVSANLTAMLGDAAGAFNIGTGVETSVNRLYELLKEKTGYAGDKRHGPAKTGEQYRSVLDCSLARGVLGWKDAVSLEDGLMRTVEFFRARVS